MAHSRTDSIIAKTPREAAYIALLLSNKEGIYLQNTLNQWRQDTSPSSQDAALAQEIAYGTTRMQLALDYLSKDNRPKKRKERLLLQMALYQHFFMDRIPLYAIVDESVQLAKKHCHTRFASFLNAYLRQLEKKTLLLPKGESADSLSIRYSFPLFFVEKLLHEYGTEQTKQILSASNLPSQTFARVRSEKTAQQKKDSLVCTQPFPMLRFSSEDIKKHADDPNFYIQNITHATLIGTLAKQLTPPPKEILDLCSAPGGKAIALHDLFPESNLTVNDPNKKRLKTLQENLKKYNIQTTVTSFPGEQFPTNQKYDLILIDTPCSNSGVLSRRPEARWRLTPEQLVSLTQLQTNLINHASSLLRKDGQIWYLTCSILKDENEHIVNQCNLLKSSYMETILPNETGFDGGFACNLSLSLRS